MEGAGEDYQRRGKHDGSLRRFRILGLCFGFAHKDAPLLGFDEFETGECFLRLLISNGSATTAPLLPVFVAGLGFRSGVRLPGYAGTATQAKALLACSPSTSLVIACQNTI